MWIKVLSPHSHIINSRHISEIVISYKGPSKYAVVAVVNGAERIIEIATNDADAKEVIENLWTILD